MNIIIIIAIAGAAVSTAVIVGLVTAARTIEKRKREYNDGNINVSRSAETGRWVVRGGTISSMAGGKSATKVKASKSDPSKPSVMRNTESRVGKSRFD